MKEKVSECSLRSPIFLVDLTAAGQKYLTEQLHESKKEMHVMKQKQMKLAARHKQLQRAVLKRDKTLRQTQDANRSSLPVPVPLLESLMVAPAGNWVRSGKVKFFLGIFQGAVVRKSGRQH